MSCEIILIIKELFSTLASMLQSDGLFNVSFWLRFFVTIRFDNTVERKKEENRKLESFPEGIDEHSWVECEHELMFSRWFHWRSSKKCFRSREIR